MNDLQDVLQQVQHIVREAARAELLPRFTRAAREFKADGSIVTEADIAMQARVHAALAQAGLLMGGLLGEEMSAEEQQRLLADTSRGIWLLDPLDGTSNYAAGIPCFSVSLALVRDGVVSLGLVYDPVRDECFTAVAGQGACLNGERLHPKAAGVPLSRSIAMVDFKRLPRHLAQRIAEQSPYASQRNFGSAVLDWCWLAAGRGHVYLHGGQKLWDFAAASLILAEAGGHAVTLEGESVFRPALVSRSVAAALDREMFEAWRGWLEIL